MALNKILPFADTASGGNVLTDTAYLMDAQRNLGHQPGIARQELANKQARQSSIIAAGVAQFLAESQPIDVVDTLTPTQISSMITNGVNSKISISSSIVKYFTPTTIPTTNVGASIFVETQGYMHWDSATSSYKRDDILTILASSAYFSKWDYAKNRYNIRQFGYIEKPTTASPLLITLPIAFPNGVLADISLNIAGALNPNGSAISIGTFTQSTIWAYTTTGGAGFGIIYSVSGY